MARRAERYRIRSGSVETEVSKATFDALVAIGWARLASAAKTAVMHPRYRLWIDHQTGTFHVDVAEPPAPDRHAIRSVFYLIFARAIYAGAPSSVLYAWHDQVHQGTRPPARVA